MAKHPHDVDLMSLLRCPQAPVDLSRIDTSATPGAPGDKKDTAKDVELVGEELADLQERLYARGRWDRDSARRVLVVLQGLDTSGKGGVVRHTFSLVDPQGLHHAAFAAPTEEEKAHDFLWRIRRELPGPGKIGVFDRSHYEDVLVVRVENLVDEKTWSKRYDIINEFEAELATEGTTILKCFLAISPQTQKERLAARLDDPTKYWKYDAGDLEARSHWDEYMAAYTEVLERCNPDIAPWYVIPSDHKWYRNWAVGRLMLETMRAMGLTWPPADFDVEAEKKRVAAL